MNNDITEELHYIRGRMDEVYNILNTDNARITKLETTLNLHTYSSYKNMMIVIASITIIVNLVEIVLSHVGLKI